MLGVVVVARGVLGGGRREKGRRKISGREGVFLSWPAVVHNVQQNKMTAGSSQAVVSICFLELLYGWHGWDSDIWLGRFAKLLRVRAESKHTPLQLAYKDGSDRWYQTSPL